MPNPRVCDSEVYQNGEVLIVESLGADSAEEWVSALAALSSQKVDWHYFAGRMVVKYIGDELRVKEALEALMPELRRRQANERAKLYD